MKHAIFHWTTGMIIYKVCLFERTTVEIDNPRSTIVNGDDVDVDNGFGGASILTVA